ncbi:CGNR zinc finger domain-containing protein [Actinomadura sp. NPDC047616]|uniref:CGNR zinc finger domain-containing protein n=1 Tax=Actinomadura sp. NPDC047616 TaxID=3155914 RepID=UPI0033CD1654
MGASGADAYRNDGVGTAVALVNAVTARGAHASDEGLREILLAFKYAAAELSAPEASTLRRWARDLRPVFEAEDVTAAVALLNGLLAAVPMQPHISDHGLGPHMHYAVSGAALPDRLRAHTAMGLATLVCEYGVDRLGVCALDDCDRVYADLNRGRRRRYCSRACLNRGGVAAFRARRRTPGP